uniref:Uncharacterized protein n=1 Tax=Siphoviridae sp. ctWhx86 TaxID=2826362 RepID=A0A8S5QNN5_9CAUD|nr:MAG TPA: hypothetical protein [Siphoviridae sp. ctWhx86]
MAKISLSQASFVERGYGQVEPNHLSAKWTGQIYAQLPVNADIDVLENGQFVKYDYANHEINFTGKGEWMLVYNEVKVYRDYETDADFAMKKEDYAATVYSPGGAKKAVQAAGLDYSKVVKPADAYEVDSTATPMGIAQRERETLMPTGTTMVPRVFKTNVGDIYTTNMINVGKKGEEGNQTEVAVADGGFLAPDAKGILTTVENAPVTGMVWQIAKVYDLADGQKAVKIVRIA